jgi:hypothetical protein
VYNAAQRLAPDAGPDCVLAQLRRVSGGLGCGAGRNLANIRKIGVGGVDVRQLEGYERFHHLLGVSVASLQKLRDDGAEPPSQRVEAAEVSGLALLGDDAQLFRNLRVRSRFRAQGCARSRRVAPGRRARDRGATVSTHHADGSRSCLISRFTSISKASCGMDP